jgi:hypothetical protein
VSDLAAAEIARALATRVDQLVKDVLPAGRREGREWRAGNVQGDQGSSLAVRLSGPKAGLWNDFASGESGDALDLVHAALDVDMRAALAWSRRWLGLKGGGAELPNKPVAPAPAPEPELDPDRWKTPWRTARPIAGSLAESYLAARGLRLDDPTGRVLRFTARRGRKSPEDKIEHHPALLAALSDGRSGEQCGIINIYLKPDGSDRLRDKKGKPPPVAPAAPSSCCRHSTNPRWGSFFAKASRPASRSFRTKCARSGPVARQGRFANSRCSAASRL